MDVLLLRIGEAAKLLGICRSQAYLLVNAGTIPSVRIGRSVRVPKAALEEWIRSQTRAGE